jgi:hypothetical protein
MKIFDHSAEQARIVTQALYAVASAEGTIPMVPIQHESIAAIQRHLMGCREPFSDVAYVFPRNIAAVLADEGQRRQVLRLLIMVPFIDRRVVAAKAHVVYQAASLLGVDDSGLVMLRQAVNRQHIRITVGVVSRAIRAFWSGDGKSRWKDWTDIMLVMLPKFTRARGRRQLREKYQALREYQPASLGNVLYCFYRTNGLALPGERGGFPEKFVLHECYHIFGGYPVNHHGEMLVAAFTGGNVETLCMDMILLSLLQYQVGVRVAGLVLGVPGQLKPEEFFHAVARGAAMRIDLMEGWDFWHVAERPLGDLRVEYGLPPLTGRETFAALAA